MARKEGYNVLSRIVFKDNADAVKRYHRAGVDLVRRIPLEPHPLLPRVGECFRVKTHT